MNLANQNRIDYLDSVRSFALLLGIVFHASLSFVPFFIGWAVMDISTSNVITVFILISHSFRMELFFLIAGFFSHMKFHKEGVSGFFKSRFVRIAIPFFIGWFILRPLLVSGWTMGGESMRGDVNILSGLIEGFKSIVTMPSSLFVGTHLWFLYYLLIISTVVIIFRSLLTTNRQVSERLTAFFDVLVSKLGGSSFGLLIMSIPTAVCVWFMNNWGVDTPDKSLIPHLPVSLLYGCFFLFGWLLHRQLAVLDTFTQITWVKVVLCIAAVISTLMLARFESQPMHANYDILKVAYSFSYAVMMWTLVVITMGCFKRFLDRPSKKVRYIADSSYWLYLIHLPIVIWLQIAFAEVEWHWSLKLMSVSGITIILSLVLYDLMVRSTFIGKVLTGTKKSRQLFTFSRRNNTVSDSL